MCRKPLIQMMVAVSMVLWSSDIYAEWARFRGPNGNGISTEKHPLPTNWNGTRNLQWKIPLPGPGSSSPIVVGDKIFVTYWSGYGMDRRNPGELKQLRRHLICIDRHTGKTLWSVAIAARLPEISYSGMITQHGYASHTPVSDGKHVYAFFGKSGVFCFDMEGKQVWQRHIGKESDPEGRGSASSPILHKDLLIVTAGAESEALVALDRKTGKEVWRQEAAGLNATWGTPALAQAGLNRTDLVIAVPREIWGLNPNTGGCVGIPRGCHPEMPFQRDFPRRASSTPSNPAQGAPAGWPSGQEERVTSPGLVSSGLPVMPTERRHPSSTRGGSTHSRTGS